MFWLKRLCSIDWPIITWASGLVVVGSSLGGNLDKLLVVVAGIFGAGGGEDELLKLSLCIEDRSLLARIGVGPFVPKNSVDGTLAPTYSVGEGVAVAVGIACAVVIAAERAVEAQLVDEAH